MSILKTIAELVRKPFPEGENKFWYYGSLSILSIFVCVFLYIYKPFGIHQIKNNVFLISLGFGAMTFLGGTVYILIIQQIKRYRKKCKPFTFGKWLLNNLGAMFCISFANFIFARLVFFGYFEWSLFPAMLYGTFMVGIIPLTMIGGFALLKQDKKRQNTVAKIKESGDYSSNQNQHLFKISLNQIKYIEALQNFENLGSFI